MLHIPTLPVLLVLAPHGIQHFVDLVSNQRNRTVTLSPSVTIFLSMDSFVSPISDTPVKFFHHQTPHDGVHDGLAVVRDATRCFFGDLRENI